MLKIVMLIDVVFVALLHKSDWQHHMPLFKALDDLQFVVAPRATVERTLVFYSTENEYRYDREKILLTMQEKPPSSGAV